MCLSTWVRNLSSVEGAVGGVVFKNDAMAELAADKRGPYHARHAGNSDIAVRKSPTLPMFDWRHLR